MNSMTEIMPVSGIFPNFGGLLSCSCPFYELGLVAGLELGCLGEKSQSYFREMGDFQQ